MEFSDAKEALAAPSPTHILNPGGSSSKKRRHKPINLDFTSAVDRTSIRWHDVFSFDDENARAVKETEFKDHAAYGEPVDVFDEHLLTVLNSSDSYRQHLSRDPYSVEITSRMPVVTFKERPFDPKPATKGCVVSMKAMLHREPAYDSDTTTRSRALALGLVGSSGRVKDELTNHGRGLSHEEERLVQKHAEHVARLADNNDLAAMADVYSKKKLKSQRTLTGSLLVARNNKDANRGSDRHCAPSLMFRIPRTGGCIPHSELKRPRKSDSSSPAAPRTPTGATSPDEGGTSLSRWKKRISIWLKSPSSAQQDKPESAVTPQSKSLGWNGESPLSSPLGAYPGGSGGKRSSKPNPFAPPRPDLVFSRSEIAAENARLGAQRRRGNWNSSSSKYTWVAPELFSSARAKKHCSLCPYDSNNPLELTRWGRIRSGVHMVFENPEYNVLARIVNIIVVISIMMATVSVVLETLPELHDQTALWDLLEMIVVVIFSTEYVLRVFATRSILRFHMDFWNVIDLLAIVPFYMELMVQTDDLSVLRVFRVVRLIRLFRIFQIPGLDTYTRILALAVKKSAPMLLSFIFLLLLALTIFASLFFSAEKGTFDESTDTYRDSNGNKSASQHIPHALWWAIQTTTGEGYGDVTPTDTLGKVLASMAAIAGILVLSIPISIMGIFFQHAFHEVNSETKTIESLLHDLEMRERDLRRIFADVEELLHDECDAAHIRLEQAQHAVIMWKLREEMRLRREGQTMAGQLMRGATVFGGFGMNTPQTATNDSSSHGKKGISRYNSDGQVHKPSSSAQPSQKTVVSPAKVAWGELASPEPEGREGSADAPLTVSPNAPELAVDVNMTPHFRLTRQLTKVRSECPIHGMQQNGRGSIVRVCTCTSGDGGDGKNSLLRVPTTQRQHVVLNTSIWPMILRPGGSRSADVLEDMSFLLGLVEAEEPVVGSAVSGGPRGAMGLMGGGARPASISGAPAMTSTAMSRSIGLARKSSDLQHRRNAQSMDLVGVEVDHSESIEMDNLDWKNLSARMGNGTAPDRPHRLRRDNSGTSGLSGTADSFREHVRGKDTTAVKRTRRLVAPDVEGGFSRALRLSPLSAAVGHLHSRMRQSFVRGRWKRALLANQMFKQHCLSSVEVSDGYAYRRALGMINESEPHPLASIIGVQLDPQVAMRIGSFPNFYTQHEGMVGSRASLFSHTGSLRRDDELQKPGALGPLTSRLADLPSNIPAHHHRRSRSSFSEALEGTNAHEAHSRVSTPLEHSSWFSSLRQGTDHSGDRERVSEEQLLKRVRKLQRHADNAEFSHILGVVTRMVLHQLIAVRRFLYKTRLAPDPELHNDAHRVLELEDYFRSRTQRTVVAGVHTPAPASAQPDFPKEAGRHQSPDIIISTPRTPGGHSALAHSLGGGQDNRFLQTPGHNGSLARPFDASMTPSEANDGFVVCYTTDRETENLHGGREHYGEKFDMADVISDDEVNPNASSDKSKKRGGTVVDSADDEQVDAFGPIRDPRSGPVVVDLTDGKARYLCRCGQSASFPHCDGSHQAVNRRTGAQYTPMRVCTRSTGKDAVYICACGRSRNRPFCDGSHDQKDSPDDDGYDGGVGDKVQQPVYRDVPPTASNRHPDPAVKPATSLLLPTQWAGMAPSGDEAPSPLLHTQTQDHRSSQPSPLDIDPVSDPLDRPHRGGARGGDRSTIPMYPNSLSPDDAAGLRTPYNSLDHHGFSDNLYRSGGRGNVGNNVDTRNISTRGNSASHPSSVNRHAPTPYNSLDYVEGGAEGVFMVGQGNAAARLHRIADRHASPPNTVNRDHRPTFYGGEESSEEPGELGRRRGAVGGGGSGGNDRVLLSGGGVDVNMLLNSHTLATAGSPSLPHTHTTHLATAPTATVTHLHHHYHHVPASPSSAGSGNLGNLSREQRDTHSHSRNRH